VMPEKIVMVITVKKYLTGIMTTVMTLLLVMATTTILVLLVLVMALLEDVYKMKIVVVVMIQQVKLPTNLNHSPALKVTVTVILSGMLHNQNVFVLKKVKNGLFSSSNVLRFFLHALTCLMMLQLLIMAQNGSSLVIGMFVLDLFQVVLIVTVIYPKAVLSRIAISALKSL